MKRHLGSIAAAVAVLMFAPVSPAIARGGGGSHGGGGFGGSSHGSGSGQWHGSAGWGHYGHGHYDGHGHYGHGYYGFYGGFWPGWWVGGPYWWPPYYYDDYYDYYGYPPPYSDYGNPPAYYSGGAPAPYPQYDGRDCLMLGHDSGKALRRKAVTRDWLVEYLRAYIINASPSVRDDFQRGFISGYGDGAEAVLKKATEEARSAKPQSTTPPAPRSDTSPKQP